MQDAAQCKLPRNRPPPAAILIEGPTPPRTRSLEPRAPRYVVTYDAGQADAEPRSAPARLVRSSFGASTSLSSAARNAAAADADPENPEPPPVCAVCLDEMMGDERAVTELPCGHQFHSACLAECRRLSSDRCPMCRSATQLALPEPPGPDSQDCTPGQLLEALCFAGAVFVVSVFATSLDMELFPFCVGFALIGFFVWLWPSSWTGQLEASRARVVPTPQPGPPPPARRPEAAAAAARLLLASGPEAGVPTVAS